MKILNNIDLSAVFNPEILGTAGRIVLIAGIGYLLLRILVIVVRRTVAKNLADQTKMLISKAIVYTGVVILLVAVMNEMGVRLSALLGAAGIAGVAIGIASQRSLGNIISGLFLVSEKTFEIGDLVRVGGQSGLVYSIDLLSVKLRTFDNLLIRIPHETIISSELTNITRFPIRRMDFSLGVAYKEDLRKVRELLLDIAAKNPLCLDEPAPLFVFKDFDEYAITMLFAVWFEKSHFLDVKNSIFLEIKERFDREGIEIPFPHVTLYTGSVTEPFPITSRSTKRRKFTRSSSSGR